ncbi:MAG: hypothetical protein WDA13_00230 [Candidatus Shapirobacteria bacterium]
MNRQYLEYMNLITDAKRAIYELTDSKVGNKSYFLKQYIKNISLITNKNKDYFEKLNIQEINSNKTNPKIKAEYLLDNNRIILDYINKNLTV